MSDSKHTKNEFKRTIKNMSHNDLTKEYNDLNLQLMKAKNLSSKGQNPYHKGQYNPKLIKWKIGLINQQLLLKCQSG